MAAYAYAATVTRNSESSVRSWVKLEEEQGMDGLESRRDNCGAETRYSPSKRARIDELMEETEGEVTQRQVQEALGLGSHHTAADYVVKAGCKKAIAAVGLPELWGGGGSPLSMPRDLVAP